MLKKISLMLAVVILPFLVLIFYFIPAFRGDIAVVSGFHIGPVLVRFYGILIAAAIWACYAIALRLASRFGFTANQIENALPWLVIFGLAGARLYYAIFSWDDFQDHPWQILQIWKGGLSIYGGLAGAALGLAIYAKRSGIHFAKIFDLAAVTLPLGQAIGRFGNFFNQEAFGTPTTLPWGMYVEPQFRPFEYLFVQSFHPAFLYESVWNLFVFFLLVYLVRTGISASAGRLAGTYLILYSIGRYFIESLRVDSFFMHSFRVDQITAQVMMIAGAIILFISYHAQRSKQTAQIN